MLWNANIELMDCNINEQYSNRNDKNKYIINAIELMKQNQV